MASINQNFEIYAGDTKLINVTVTNSDGTVVDLTGATIKWAIKKGTTNVVYKDTVSGITISGPTQGKFTIALNPVDTSTLSGNFYHEAEVTDAIGNVSTVLIGVASIKTSYV